MWRRLDRATLHYGINHPNNNLRGIKAVKVERDHLHHVLESKGREIYTTDSRLCPCGKPALRVWKNKAWCKSCYKERG